MDVRSIAAAVSALAILSLPIAPAALASNSIAFVDHASGVVNSCSIGNTTTQTMSSGSPAAGNMLIFAESSRGSSSIPGTPVDSQGNTWHQFESSAYGTSTAARGSAVWWAISNGNTVASENINMDCTGVATQFVFYEFSGTDTSSNPIDLHGHSAWQGEVTWQITHQAHTSGTTPVQPAMSDELAVYIVFSPNNATFVSDTANYDVKTVDMNSHGNNLGSVAAGYNTDAVPDPSVYENPIGSFILDTSNVTTSQATTYTFGVKH